MGTDPAIQIWRVTVDAFDARLEEVEGELWQAATPCEGWTVRDLVDHAVHTWDLARAVGADEALPQDAVVACYAAVRLLPPEIARSPEVFAAAVEVGEDADPQTRLLAHVGRQV